MDELEELKHLYIEDLSKIVDYYGNPRQRVRNIPKWKNLISLPDTSPIDISSTDRKVFIWSDIHFGHENIINFCDRPYPDADTMNECIMDNFNETVGEDDISIWVGDVGFLSTTKLNQILGYLHGYKILVIGNHDFKGKKLRNLAFDEKHLLLQVTKKNIDMVFTHYPMENLPYPFINIHGHIHNIIKNSLQHINVSVEMPYINYKPIQLSDLVYMAISRHNSI